MPQAAPLPAITTNLSAITHSRNAPAAATPLPLLPTSLEAKLVVLGAQGVGKTSIVNRFLDPHKPLNAKPTVGASFVTKIIHDADSNTTVRLQIWDTAGQERFHSISKLYYRGAHAGILCYDVTSERSWEEMKVWLDEIRRECEIEFDESKPGEGMVLHVVGTKVDLVTNDPSMKQVPFEKTIAYVAEHVAAATTTTKQPVATATQLAASTTPPHPFLSRTATLGALPTPGLATGVRSPDSKRSSGFWTQDVGWDSCHEVSARDNDGIEEVFRVISKKLIEQRNKREAYHEQTTAWNGNATKGGTDYFSQDTRPSSIAGRSTAGGSFRLGHNRNRSWLGLGIGGIGGQSKDQGHAVVSEVRDTNGNWVKADEDEASRGRCC